MLLEISFKDPIDSCTLILGAVATGVQYSSKRI